MIELYRFQQGNQIYNLTSSSIVEIWEGIEYTPVSITRGSVKHTSDLSAFDISISLDKNHPVVPLSIFRDSDNPLSLRIIRIRNNEEVGIWNGRVTNATIDSPVEAKLECRPIIEVMDRSGLSTTYARECRHSLYGTGCGVNRENFRYAAQITEQSGPFVRIPEVLNHPEGFFSLGYVEWGNIRRGIMRVQSDAWVELAEPFINLSVPQDVNIYAGCNRTLTTCREKFDNAINYGGFPWVPRKNPFDTTLY